MNIAPKENYTNSSFSGSYARKGKGNASAANKFDNDKSDYRIVSVISLDESILRSSRYEKRPGRKKTSGYKTEKSEFLKEAKSTRQGQKSLQNRENQTSEVQKKAIESFAKKYDDKNFSNILDYSIINVN